ncbi:MAG TPA: polysaccharide biosynthesis/export family protein [Bryobacteraceae bacterium]|nr:polysaccharide biosynthesis/export family protein [Bryobacteraceae bacterium]
MRNHFPRNLLAAVGAAAICLAAAGLLPGQAPAPGPTSAPAIMPSAGSTPIVPPPVVDHDAKAAYVLGPDDQISVTVLNVPEVSDKVYRIDLNGNVKLPMVTGRIQAAGLTIEQLEEEIAGMFKTILKNPQVTVSIVSFRREPVSILGAVRNPGVIQLEGRTTLVDALSAAGGLSDDAGYTVKIVRRREYGRIPLPSATDDPSGDYSTAEVDTKDILEAKNPAQNIVLCPRDEITVPRGEMIYVVGTVLRAGGFVLQQRSTLSVLQALSLAGGTGPGASTKNTKILRSAPGGASHIEIPINLTAILRGKAPDVGMQSGDILFVPSSTPKKTLAKMSDVATLAASALVYRIP